MSSDLHPNFHHDAQEPEVIKLRRALQKTLGQLVDAQAVLSSREPKYVPVRTANGRTQVWIPNWVVKPFKDWDHNEVGALLETVALSEGRPSEYEAYSLMESCRGNGHIDEWIWDAMGPKAKAIAEKVSKLVRG